MDLYKEILVKILQRQEMQIVFPNMEINATEIVELESYKALQNIKALIHDESLEDEECFMQIDEIICVFERLGSDGGDRHDFC